MDLYTKNKSFTLRKTFGIDFGNFFANVSFSHSSEKSETEKLRIKILVLLD